MHKNSLLLLSIALLFLVIKAPNISLKLSDTNIYFYNGYQIIQGQILYKDVFFTNLPVIPYMSAFYFFISGGNVLFYYATAILESLITGIIIYASVRSFNRSHALAVMSMMLYLFSFILLATTEHQTGVFLASLTSALSVYFYAKQKYIFVGIFTAFALLAKAYFIPLALSYVVFLIIKRQFHKLFLFLTGVSITALIILLPSLIFAPRELMQNVFEYSLTRSAGLSKSEILWFFVMHDIVLVLILMFNALTIKKHIFFGLFSLFSLAFILLYQDIYYLYLNFMLPVLCISFMYTYDFLRTKIATQRMVVPTILSLFFMINIWQYTVNFSTLQKIPDVTLLTEHIKQLRPAFLYGTNDITPLLSYLTGVPMLDNITDTNNNLYRKGLLNATELTQKAVASDTLLIGHGVNYPLYNVRQQLVDEIFDQKVVSKTCTITGGFPVRMEGIMNEINIARCY